MGLLNTVRFISQHPLSERRIASRMLRYARWQISSRVSEFESIVPFANQTRLIAKKGRTGATGNVYTGLHEFHEMAFVLHFLRPNDLFFDVGANIGAYTVLASGAVGANTIAIEPVPATFSSLMDNILLNQIRDKVTALNVALGSEISTVTFTTGLECCNHVVSANSEVASGTIATVPQKTLDSCLRDIVPVCVKINVEGYESEVLAGAKCLADDAVRAVIMETNGCGIRYGVKDSSLLDKMTELGFKRTTYDGLRRELRHASPEESTNGNSIFVRNCEEIQRRLDTAPRFKILEASV